MDATAFGGTVQGPCRFLHFHEDLDFLMNGQPGQLQAREVLGREDPFKKRMDRNLSPF